MHTEWQNKGSASLSSSKKNDDDSFLHGAFELLGKLSILIVVIVFLLIVFLISVKLFSKVIGIVLVAAGAIPSACLVIIKKFFKKTWKKIERSSVQPIFTMFAWIHEIIKDFCNEYKIMNDIRISTIVVILISIVLMIFPVPRAKAVRFVDHIIDKAKTAIYETIGYEEDTENMLTEEYAENMLTEEETKNNVSNDIIYPHDMTFVIDKRDCSASITSELVSETYFYHVSNPLVYLDSLYGSEYSNKEPEHYKTQDKENAFTNALQNAEKYKKVYGQDDEWYGELPTESDLLSVIDAQLEEAELYPSFYIYNRISNNYQTLALEYYYQNSIQVTIKYYYLLSIKYDIESIKHSANKKEFYIALDRIITRYKDILFCCKGDADEGYFNDLRKKLLFD